MDADPDVFPFLQAAAEHNTLMELNANPARLDLNDVHLAAAKRHGIPIVISTDAHSVQDLDLMHYGVDQAGRGWLESGDVLNTLPLGDLQSWRMRRSRT